MDQHNYTSNNLLIANKIENISIKSNYKSQESARKSYEIKLISLNGMNPDRFLHFEQDPLCFISADQDVEFSYKLLIVSSQDIYY